eukprot:6285633-Pyramimonas_sp.AAC.1
MLDRIPSLECQLLNPCTFQDCQRAGLFLPDVAAALPSLHRGGIIDCLACLGVSLYFCMPSPSFLQ